MANSKHLAELKKGTKNWNQWRRENPCIIPDLRRADLRKLDLSFADFRDAKLVGARFNGICVLSARFSKADLTNANLTDANLRFANFSNSNLSKARLIRANLSEADFMKANLSEANLSEANLTKANLRFTQLLRANLSKANLSLAFIRKAQLQNADLTAIQGLGSDFTEANFTGACLQNWNIDPKTCFESAECNYVYLSKRYGFEFIDRYPKYGNFEPGEFTTAFQKASEMTEIFFEDGVTEFLEYFEKQQNKSVDEVISIEEIEPKGDNALVVRLETLPKDEHEDQKRLNEEQFQLPIKAYEFQAREQAIELQLYKQHKAEILEVVRLMATQKSINVNVENTSMSNSPEFNNNLQGASIDNFANQVSDNATQQVNHYNCDSDTKSLADAAKEIQSLLNHLSQTYPIDTMPAKVTLATEAIRRIDNNPSLSKRIMSALKAGSTSALAQFLNHPASSFVISALEDWQKTQMQ